MSFTVLTGVRLFAVGADLTGASNKVELGAEVEEKDKTTYGSGGWKEVMGGLGSSTISGEGFWEAADLSKVDDSSWAQLGGVGPWTVCPLAATVGSLAYLSNALRSEYKFLGQVGDVAPWSAKASGTWPVVRGLVEHNPATARTSTGTTTGANLGAVAAGSRLYAALHVLSASGTLPTLDVVIQSDDNSGFTTPVTQLTFAQKTTTGTAEILRSSGTAITDNWFRASYTIAGTNPSFLFALAFGIK